ncbi:MAG: NusG domain II-containing protein [Clostridiales bacterium]|nr:NusG domain II-containing protein [Clostridiales bacterium]
MKKPLSNRFWLTLLAAALILCAVAAVFLFSRTASGTVAVITLDGETVEEIDLSAVSESYTLTFTGKSGITDVVEVSPGKIRVKEADCPDQICVHQGWIETGVAPIVCLPNALVIQIQDSGDGPDAVVG